MWLSASPPLSEHRSRHRGALARVQLGATKRHKQSLFGSNAIGPITLQDMADAQSAGQTTNLPGFNRTFFRWVLPDVALVFSKHPTDPSNACSTQTYPATFSPGPFVH